MSEVDRPTEVLGGEVEGFPAELTARFQPRRELGRGGMGAVYLASDRELGRLVAVKVLARASDPETVRRFLVEAESLAALRHPNVIEVYDSGQLESGEPYLVLEYLEGASLEKPQPGLDPLEVLLPVAEALEALHRAGLIHRDVKPANIFRTRSGRTVLLDLGLVHRSRATRLTRTGAKVGTPAFMAPETLRGAPATPHADWYGLGATLYALLEGAPPFDMEELLGLLETGKRPPLRWSDVRPAAPTVRLVEVLLDPDPNARPGSRREMEALLRRSSGDRTRAMPAAAPPGLPRWASLVWMALLAAGFAWWVSRTPPAPPTPNEALPGARPAPVQVLADAGLVPMPRNRQGYRRLRSLADDSVLLYVPGGEFTARGGPSATEPAPPRRVELPPFLVGELAVTVGQYARYVDALGSFVPRGWEGQYARPDHPVVWISHSQAKDYCDWAGGRLIRSLEWERVAAGTDGRPHPWGAEPPDATRANFGAGGIDSMRFPARYLKPGGSYPAGVSPVGAYDIVGNSATWSEDYLDFPHLKHGPEPGDLGGAYMNTADSLVTWYLRTWPAEEKGVGLGLRLVREVHEDLQIAIEELGEWPSPADPVLEDFRPLGRNEKGHREFLGRAGAHWILVPGGHFVSRASYDADTPGPRVEVELPAFLIDRHAVSVARYARFVEATGHRKPGSWEEQVLHPENPVVWVDWNDATAFARWSGARLMSSMEWERAAAGLRPYTHPWGQSPPDETLANYGKVGIAESVDPVPNLRPVDSCPEGRSPVGALNLVGNVACWTRDLLEVPSRPGIREPGDLGGGYFAMASSLKTWYRFTWPADEAPAGTGIRLTREVPPGLLGCLDPLPGKRGVRR